jgi:hypothetical protein
MRNEEAIFGRTEVKINPNPEKLHRNQVSLWMGSCFVDSFQPFLEEFQYPALVNPLGVVFHPLVLGELLFQSLESILSKNFEREGVWLNYWLGSGFSASSEEELIQQITRAKKETDAQFAKADWLVMTWGTAFWYEHEAFGLVGKCHRQPGNWFKKYRSEPEEITEKWKNWIQAWRRENPNRKVLITLSPVRHTRDGLPENAVSKSALRLAIENLCQALPSVYYYPSYELVLDELRDYRYFENDLIHPRKEAVEWIWDKFSNAFLEETEASTNQKIKEWQTLKRHRPQSPFGKEYETWKNKIGEKGKEVEELLLIEREKQKK